MIQPSRSKQFVLLEINRLLTYLLSKTTSQEFAPPVTRCSIPLVTPAACLLMQTRAECGREIPNSLSVSRHRNHITFESVPKVARFLKACPPLNQPRCQGWSPLSFASTQKPQTSNVAYISSTNARNTGLLRRSKRVLCEDNPLDAALRE